MLASINTRPATCVFLNPRYNACIQEGLGLPCLILVLERSVTQFRFTPARIDEHIVSVGVDVRPVIDVRAERQKLADFGRWLTDEWPSLYENVVQGPNAFFVTKKFVFPGKGEADLQTLVLTNRGPVFLFPYKVGILAGEDIELPERQDVVMKALEQLKQKWPQCKQVRLGVVRDFCYDCSPESPIDIVRGRFTRLNAAFSTLTLGFNLPSDDFNRTVRVQTGQMPVLGESEARPVIGVQVDFNNSQMDADLTKETKLRILHDADEFCEKDLISFLNGEGIK